MTYVCSADVCQTAGSGADKLLTRNNSHLELLSSAVVFVVFILLLLKSLDYTSPLYCSSSLFSQAQMPNMC